MDGHLDRRKGGREEGKAREKEREADELSGAGNSRWRRFRRRNCNLGRGAGRGSGVDESFLTGDPPGRRPCFRMSVSFWGVAGPP